MAPTKMVLIPDKNVLWELISSNVATNANKKISCALDFCRLGLIVKMSEEKGVEQIG